MENIFRKNEKIKIVCFCVCQPCLEDLGKKKLGKRLI